MNKTVLASFAGLGSCAQWRWQSAFNENPTALLDVYTQRLSDPDEKKNSNKHRRLKSCLEHVKGMKGHTRIAAKVECLIHVNEH